MMTRERAYALIDLLVSKSRFDVVVKVSEEDLGLTRFANSEIHQNVVSHDTVVEITVFDGEKMATVTTNVLSDEALLSALNQGELMLPLLQPSGMRFEPLENYTAIEVDDQDQSFETLWGIEERADAIAKEVTLLPVGFSAAGAFEVKHTVLAWGNSKGVRRFYAGSHARVEIMISHASGASGYNDLVVKRASDLDINMGFEFALTKAQEGLEAISLEPGAYDVVLEPLAVNDLMCYLGYIGGNSKFHIDGLSPFTGRLNQAVASEVLSLTDDALHPSLIGRPFDAEGYPRQSLAFIDKGVFKGIAYDSHTAKLSDALNTGHSLGYKGEGGIPLNLVMEPGSAPLKDLIKDVARGLLVSRFHYMNIVDPRNGTLTALTRDGLFLIEEGKVTQAVKNLRFTDAIGRILMSVEAVSSEQVVAQSFYGTNLMSGLKVKGLRFSNKTEIE